MKKLSIGAILSGSLVDLVGSGVLGVPLMLYVLVTRHLFTLPQDKMKTAVIESIHHSLGLYAMQLAIGITASIIGGYVAGRIAKHDHVLNGALSAIGCFAAGVFSMVSGKESEPLVVQLLLLLVVTPAAAAAGGYWAAPKTHRVSQAA